MASTVFSNGVVILPGWLNDVNAATYGTRRGTGTVLATMTSAVVTHGLGAAPAQVLITPQGNLGDTWISAIGATQFTLNCSSAPAGDTPFSWQVSA